MLRLDEVLDSGRRWELSGRWGCGRRRGMRGLGRLRTRILAFRPLRDQREGNSNERIRQR